MELDHDDTKLIDRPSKRILPYAMSDKATAIASIALDKLLAVLKPGGT